MISGRTEYTYATSPAVTRPSPIPMSACQKAIAPTTGTSGAAPDNQTMTAADTADAMHATHPARNEPRTRPERVSLTRSARLYIHQPTNGATIAMFTMLAPRLVTPPSAKKNACTMSTAEITSAAGSGPSSMAASAPPAKCPEVPPATGKLSI